MLSLKGTSGTRSSADPCSLTRNFFWPAEVREIQAPGPVEGGSVPLVPAGVKTHLRKSLLSPERPADAGSSANAARTSSRCDRNTAAPAAPRESASKLAPAPRAPAQSQNKSCPTRQGQAGQEHLEEYHLLPRTHISDETDNLWLRERTTPSAKASRPQRKIAPCTETIDPSGYLWLSAQRFIWQNLCSIFSQVSLLVSRSFARVT